MVLLLLLFFVGDGAVVYVDDIVRVAVGGWCRKL